MWALRSLPRRPHPLISGRRHAIQQSAAVGRSNLIIGSRGYASNSNDDSHAEVNPAATKRRHLYVVLDDHKDGYGIYKLDTIGDNDEDDDLDTSARRRRRLPGPPLLRVAFPAVGDLAQFTAVGSSIVAISTGFGIQEHKDEVVGSAFIYDTETAAMVASAQIPEGLFYGYDAAMAVGQRLYMLESDEGESTSGAIPGGLHCLAADGGGYKNRWDWHRPLSASSRWSWTDYLMLPFQVDSIDSITGHAVHAPPGAAHHDIFVSATSGGTFSFSSATGKWTRRSKRLMPVVGHAHYDGKLDTWVGLSSVYSDWVRQTDGHLCTFDVTDAQLAYEVTSEKLFRLDEDIAAGWRHIDAKLVPMGPFDNGGSKYCLMERLRPEGNDKKECLGEGDKCLLRLTSFYLERDKDGDPVTIARRRARSYKVSRYNVDFHAQAFWM